MSEESTKFERAWVATQYLLGARNMQLLEGLAEPSAEARALVRRLSVPDRTARARALAADLGPLVHALKALELG